VNLTNERIDVTKNEANIQKARNTMETLCSRCRFHPASPRIAGYCSWDCYEADDDDGDGASDGKGEQAA
jgi:hypothetical protein